MRIRIVQMVVMGNKGKARDVGRDRLAAHDHMELGAGRRMGGADIAHCNRAIEGRGMAAGRHTSSRCSVGQRDDSAFARDGTPFE